MPLENNIVAVETLVQAANEEFTNNRLEKKGDFFDPIMKVKQPQIGCGERLIIKEKALRDQQSGKYF